ncbi:hypothetical protein C7Y47_24365 [Lysinibacillus sphaericus]|uniref:Uncharacterized protein n=1 Tax=Lysinibacillus sphaericus TaxID=1421 RepID=A0A544U4E8_LYSSH|nr:hypothetical protein [Lysinibacillus sp. SDF0037]TQR25628.1 hypothetical protein C7Y47_24365 [Lysinibacillus sp. SDF0037]
MDISKIINIKAEHNILDKNYEQLVNEFLEIQNIKSGKSSVISFLVILYSDLMKDNKLISKNNSSLLLNKVTLMHIMKFQTNIESLVTLRKLTKETGQEIPFIINDFLNFLSKKNIVKIYYKPLHFIPIPTQTFAKNNLSVISGFREYLTQKNYTHINIYVNSVENFFKHSCFECNNLYNELFWKENIKKYEETLRLKVLKGTLAPATSYQYLKRIKLFLDFLYSEDIINFNYQIPSKMKHHGKRSNEYVEVKDILIVLDTVLETSSDILRDLTIFLIMIETGCRSIENRF